MENKEIKITAPEGYEIDKENSTFECIKFKKKSVPTYQQVLLSLASRGNTFNFMDMYGRVYESNNWASLTYVFTLFNERQAARLFAINKLMNVAEYLNKGWKPDWDNINEPRYSIIYDHDDKEVPLGVGSCYNIQEASAVFKDFELALQAIEILGEDTIKIALGVE